MSESDDLWAEIGELRLRNQYLEEERDAAVAQAERLNTLLGELYHWALDACHQGTGEPFQSSSTWHMFMSTWEEANELLPRVRDALVAEREGGPT